ncbi:F-box protein [Zea mays]|uniref:F-box protein n=1 Tax=Zea mays TaxID=4577 RepID=A0A317Y4C5_MAIZE|nr:F-box protein [Zea mays]
METEDSVGWDFLDWLGPDISTTIFQLLHDPADLARVAAVSRSWRRFGTLPAPQFPVIVPVLGPVAELDASAVLLPPLPASRAVAVNKFSKHLCRQICPEAASFTRAVVSSQVAECRARDGEHAAYSYLAGALVSGKPATDLVMRCVGASSTDNFPDETIENTLVPHDMVNFRPSYWSSGGEDDPDVPESLTYTLASDLCVIEEIRIRPFEATFQHGHPIYSSKAENVLQTFKLPRPALCIGGIVKIELLGRIQKQFTDDKYYICVCHVQVTGRSLSPDLMIDLSDPAGYSNLKYLPGAGNLRPEDLISTDAKDSPDWRSLVSRYRQMRQLAMVYMLLGPVQLQFMDEDEADLQM